MANNTDLVTYGAPAEQYFSVKVYDGDVPTEAGTALQGYTSLRIDNAGWTPTAALNRSDAYKDWRGDAILDGPADPSADFDIPIVSQTALAEQIKFGNSSGTGGNVSSHFGGGGNDTTYTVVVDELWNDADGMPTRASRWAYPKCSVREVALGPHTRTGVIIDTVTFKPLADSAHNYMYHYTAVASGGPGGGD